MPSVTMAMMMAHLYESYLCMIVLGRGRLQAKISASLASLLLLLS